MMLLRTMMILKTMIILKIMMIIRQFEEIGDFENLALWMTGSALYTRWLVVVQLLAENEPRERILYIFSCIRSDQNWERILRIFSSIRYDQNWERLLRIFSCIRSKLHIDCEGQVKLTWRKLVHWRQCLWNLIWCKSEIFSLMCL